MKAVLYARVSSEKQAEKDLSISAQLKALRRYGEEHSFEVIKEYIDEAESARTADRPSFQEMISLAKSKQKPFDAVLVWKLSRFARNREDSIVFKSLLKKRGIQVISVSEPIDDSPTGKLLEGMIEVIDEFYSENLSQEARRGLREAASRGFFPGGSVPFGYRLVTVSDGRAKRRKLDLDSDSEPIVRRIFDLCLRGKGAKEISKELNADKILTRNGSKWTKATILYILKNRIYTGDFIWPKGRKLRRGDEQVVLRNHHHSIIDSQAFDQVQRNIGQRSSQIIHPRRLVSNYLLSNLLFCKQCGKAMTGGKAKSGRYKYYTCYTQARVDTKACDCKPISTVKIETAVVENLKSHVITDENLKKLLELTNSELARLTSSNDKQLETLKKEFAATEKRLDKLYDAIEAGSLTAEDISPRIRKLNTRADELRNLIRCTEQDLILQSSTSEGF